MDISVQYLEGGYAADVSPSEARRRLRQTFERMPLARVLLGWDLDMRVVEACADECSQHGCELYFWQPVLTGHGSFTGEPSWRVMALNGEPASALDGKAEFTFFCPNGAEARQRILEGLSETLAGGLYDGVFLDRIRFPSPSRDFAGQFGCFCEACRAAAREAGLDLSAAREDLLKLTRSREGRRTVAAAMFRESASGEEATSLRRMLEFRQRSVTRFVHEAAEAAHSAGLKVGLDCFSPTLTRMVGQDLASLGEYADWMKVMTYVRAFAPASLPYELVGLADWLMSTEGETEQAALGCLAQATGWSLPRSRDAIRQGGLPVSILTEELHRGRSANRAALLAGIELVDIPDLTQLTPSQIRADAQAVHAAAPDGVVLCWDLWRIPEERAGLAASLYA